MHHSNLYLCLILLLECELDEGMDYELLNLNCFLALDTLFYIKHKVNVYGMNEHLRE